MIEMHIRPEPPGRPEPLRCESRQPRRELGVLRWTLASVIVLAAALDAVWLAPTRQAAPASVVPPAAPYYADAPSYSEMRRRRCRKQIVERELAAARQHVRLLEAETRSIDQAEADARARAELDARSVEVTLVRAPR